jgi:hypothetical protein
VHHSGNGLCLQSDDFDSLAERYTEGAFRQLILTIEAPPAFLRGLGELEDHGESGFARETSLRPQRGSRARRARIEARGR